MDRGCLYMHGLFAHIQLQLTQKRIKGLEESSIIMTEAKMDNCYCL